MEAQAEACSVQAKLNGTMNPCSLTVRLVSFWVSTRLAVGYPTPLIMGSISIV